MNTPNFSSKTPFGLGPKRGEPDPDLTAFLDDYAATIVEVFRANKAGDFESINSRRGMLMRGLNTYADRIFDRRLKGASLLDDAARRSQFKNRVEEKIVSASFFNSVFSEVWPSSDPLPLDYTPSPATLKAMHKAIQQIVEGQASLALGQAFVPTQRTVSLEQEPNIADESASPEKALADQEALAIQESLSSLKFYDTPVGEALRAYLSGANLRLADASALADKAVNFAMSDMELSELDMAEATGYATLGDLRQDVLTYVEQAKRL